MTITFTAPGPGTWELDTAHFPRTVSRIAVDLIEHGLPSGMTEAAELIGAPFRRMDVRFVHGAMYRRLVPLVGEGRTGSTPPAPLLWLATRLHPEFRRRTARASAASTSKVWLDENRRWLDEWKPELVARHRAAAAVDPASLDDAALSAHVVDLFTHLRDSTALHFRLHASDMGPIGRLLVRTRQWGLDDVEVMDALAGASPSTSDPVAALASLRRLLADRGVVVTDLDDVRSAGPDAAAALDAHLAEYGGRLTTGYDITDRTLAEMPELIVAALRSGGPGHPAGGELDVAAEADRLGDDTAARLRSDLAPGDRAEFDELLDEARLLYGLRDENGPLTWEWPMGLLRRAVLEAGRRLVDRASIRSVDEVFDLHAHEIAALLGGAAAPGPMEVAARHDERIARADLDPPVRLGPEEVTPASWVLPGALRELAEVTLTVLELLEARQTQPLTGVGVGDTPYRGIARVVADADEALLAVEPGDVVVTGFTVPTFNSVLAVAGAVVVEHGGLLCHTAVIARELGIAAVVGVADALTAIPDGALVEVDPMIGTVRIIDRAPIASAHGVADDAAHA